VARFLIADSLYIELLYIKNKKFFKNYKKKSLTKFKKTRIIILNSNNDINNSFL